jgi:hypothetical protein
MYKATKGTAVESYKGATERLRMMAQSLGWYCDGDLDNHQPPFILVPPTSFVLGSTKYIWQGEVDTEGHSNREGNPPVQVTNYNILDGGRKCMKDAMG